MSGPVLSVATSTISMQTTSKSLPRGQVELTIELTAAEVAPFLTRAAEVLSESSPIPGFRPGKATVAAVQARLGAAKLWEAALEPAIKKTLVTAVAEQQLATVGAPHIEVMKLVPDQPLIYRATLSLLPSVQLPDLAKVKKIEAKPVTVDESKVTAMVDELRKMRRTEALVNHPATNQDKVTVNLTMALDRVPLEHGSQQGVSLDLGSDRYVPGLAPQLVGTSAGQTKTFPLTFPAQYHDRVLAGKTVDVTAAVQGVYELTTPPADDDWAKSLGAFSTLEELREKLRENIKTEGEMSERERQEEAVTEILINTSKFGDIPDLLVTSEVNTMLQELESNVARQGVGFDDYLRQLNKDRAALKLEFAPTAVKRIKGALVTRAVAQAQQLSATDAEARDVLEETRRHYAQDAQAATQLDTAQAKAFAKNRIIARKVMEYLRSVLVQP